jgi:TolB-like protein/DNA-binding winged helix-turn-helix (wHTH) protein
LLRKGRPLRVEPKPLELLILLVSQKGHLVSRREIVGKLWEKDVFVDTDHSINTAIRKLRHLLRDDSEAPKYIETVTGMGYRFVAHTIVIEPSVPAAPEPSPAERPPIATPNPESAPDNRSTESTASEADKPAKVDEILNRPASPPSSNNGKASGAISAAETVPADTVKHSGLRWIGLAIGLLVVGTLVALNAGGIRDHIFARSQIGPIHSIAVLPLANMSGDASQDYYADGMTDELITALARNRSLRVVSRTSAMQYKGVNKPLRDIAQSLGVDGILEGSVARNGGRVHLNLQLIYGPTDTHMWADSYDRDFNQAYLLPEELAQTITREAKAASSPAPPHHYISPEAHDDYVQGLYFWNGVNPNPDRSLEYFEKAIRLQPDYAAAWSGVANSYAAQVILDEFPAKNVASKMEEAARKAVAIDDSSPEAHNAIAMWYILFAWDVPGADAESRRSLQLNPNLAETHRMRAWVLDAMHESDESFRELKQAITLDPMQYITDLGEAYMARGQFDDAIAELRRRSETEHDNFFIHADLMQIYWLKGMKKEAVEELEKIVRDDPAKTSAVRRAYTRGGSQAVAQWMIDDFKADAVRKKYLSPYEMARRYAFLGDKQNTLKYLEASYDQRYPYLIMVQSERMFDLVHSEPRYQALIKRMGLPPAW